MILWHYRKKCMLESDIKDGWKKISNVMKLTKIWMASTLRFKNPSVSTINVDLV